MRIKVERGPITISVWTAADPFLIMATMKPFIRDCFWVASEDVRRIIGRDRESSLSKARLSGIVRFRASLGMDIYERCVTADEWPRRRA
jgi:hypothetical protein